MNEYEYFFTALWTDCKIIIIKENDLWLNKIINNCYKNIIDFEKEFSRFRQDSVLSLLNKNKSFEVWDIFLDLFFKSKEIFTLTNGYFNPLVNLENIWYINSFNKWIFERKQIVENLDFSEIKNYWNLIKLPKDANLDFGSIAKWYLANKISNYLCDNWLKNNLVSLWWDIFASWKNLYNHKWIVSINLPHISWNLSVCIENESIATSGIYTRKWQIWWENFHHIKTPFASKQNFLIKSCSIISKNWYFSDAIATAVISMWYEKWLEFFKKNNIKYLLLLDIEDEKWKIITNIDIYENNIWNF